MTCTIDTLKQALEALEDYANGVHYDNEYDEIGSHDCCHALSYNPHAESCKAIKVIADINQAIKELERQESNPIKDGWQLSVADGHSGYGVYAHMEEYPEEGAFLLLPIKELESQEPALYWSFRVEYALLPSEYDEEDHPTHVPLYRNPPQRKPLTDEQIQDAVNDAVRAKTLSWVGYIKDNEPVLSPSNYQFARAIEAAHGIKG